MHFRLLKKESLRYFPLVQYYYFVFLGEIKNGREIRRGGNGSISPLPFDARVKGEAIKGMESVTEVVFDTGITFIAFD